MGSTVCRAPAPCYPVRPSILLHLRCSSFILHCRLERAHERPIRRQPHPGNLNCLGCPRTDTHPEPDTRIDPFPLDAHTTPDTRINPSPLTAPPAPKAPGARPVYEAAHPAHEAARPAPKAARPAPDTRIRPFPFSTAPPLEIDVTPPTPAASPTTHAPDTAPSFPNDLYLSVPNRKALEREHQAKVAAQLAAQYEAEARAQAKAIARARKKKEQGVAPARHRRPSDATTSNSPLPLNPPPPRTRPRSALAPGPPGPARTLD